MTDKKFVIRFALAHLGEGLVLGLVLIVLVASAIGLPWGSTNAPAWGQAIVSVLAIIVAVWVAQLQASSPRNATQAKSIEFATKLSIVLSWVLVDASRAGSARDDPAKFVNQSIFDGLKYGNWIVQNIDPVSIPTAELMSKWLAIKDVLQALEKDFEYFMKVDPKTHEERLAKELKRHALRVNYDKFIKWRSEFDVLVANFSG